MTKSTVYLMVALTVAAIAVADFVGWSNGFNGLASRRLVAANKGVAKQAGDEIYAAGIVEGTTTEIELKTETAGRIAKIFVREGQWVNQGDLLLEIANDEHRHRIELSQASLARAEAELAKLLNGARNLERDELARLYEASLAEYQRAEKAWLAIKRLEQSGATTVDEIDHHYYQLGRLRAEVAAAKARLDLINAEPRGEDVNIAKTSVATARAQLDSALVQFEKTRLIAPRRAQVLDLNAIEGETTGPELMEPVLIMADTSRLFVIAYLEEYDAMRVNINSRIRISAAGLNADVYGQVESLSPMMERKEIASLRPDELHDVRTRKVRIQLEDNAGLIIGLPVDVYFETADQE